MLELAEGFIEKEIGSFVKRNMVDETGSLFDREAAEIGDRHIFNPDVASEGIETCSLAREARGLIEKRQKSFPNFRSDAFRKLFKDGIESNPAELKLLEREFLGRAIEEEVELLR